MTVRLSAVSNSISNRSIWNDDFAAVLFPDKCGAVPRKVEKIPWLHQSSQFFGAKIILQTGKYETAYVTDVSPWLDDSQSMRLNQLRYGLDQFERVYSHEYILTANVRLCKNWEFQWIQFNLIDLDVGNITVLILYGVIEKARIILNIFSPFNSFVGTQHWVPTPVLTHSLLAIYGFNL